MSAIVDRHKQIEIFVLLAHPARLAEHVTTTFAGGDNANHKGSRAPSQDVAATTAAPSTTMILSERWRVAFRRSSSRLAAERPIAF